MTEQQRAQQQPTDSEPGGEVDLTPRATAAGDGNSRSVRNWLIVGVLGVAMVFVLYQALTNAAQFYYNVDEAVALRDDLDDETFRLQGTVVSEPAQDSDGAMTFMVAYGGVEAPVRHVGEEPSDLFEVGIPIVAEGHWESDAFESSQLLVKHSEAYEAENPDRVNYPEPEVP